GPIRVGGGGVPALLRRPASASIGGDLQVSVVKRVFYVVPGPELQSSLANASQVKLAGERGVARIAAVGVPICLAAVRIGGYYSGGGVALERNRGRSEVAGELDVLGGVLVYGIAARCRVALEHP